jgi:pyrrolysine biosynthesis protein PylC
MEHGSTFKLIGPQFLKIVYVVTMNPKPKKNYFRLGLVGGLLQGLEAVYLARECGFYVTVIDRNPQAPALSLAHEAHIFDVQKEPDRFRQLLQEMDAILPTTEEEQTLDFLANICQEVGCVFLHDSASYTISSSKVRSNSFFAHHNIPIPKKWPGCSFPVVVKPSRASGSLGVCVVFDQSALDTILPQVRSRYGEEIVVEAYHQGPSLSLEVIAKQGVGVGYLITELEFDARLDCKRVYAPQRSSYNINQNFERTCQDIARHLKLNGLIDVEVIVDLEKRNLVVLEIDARFPSQTPMAVYHASGINLLNEWIKIHLGGEPLRSPPVREKAGCVVLEHISVSNTCLEFIGETRLIPWSGVEVWPNGKFFGATVALTDYQIGKKSFKGTLIFEGVNWSEVLEKRRNCLEHMVSALGLKDISDPTFQVR